MKVFKIPFKPSIISPHFGVNHSYELFFLDCRDSPYEELILTADWLTVWNLFQLPQTFQPLKAWPFHNMHSHFLPQFINLNVCKSKSIFNLLIATPFSLSIKYSISIFFKYLRWCINGFFKNTCIFTSYLVYFHVWLLHFLRLPSLWFSRLKNKLWHLILKV